MLRKETIGFVLYNISSKVCCDPYVLLPVVIRKEKPDEKDIKRGPFDYLKGNNIKKFTYPNNNSFGIGAKSLYQS
jgi:hypothetical protein